MRLNQVTLPVTNMELAAAFYRKMGFLQIVDTPHYARFSCPGGDATFSLALREDAGNNNAVIYFELDDLDGKVAELMQRSFIFDQQPKDMRYLWREAVLQDPSGNRIKLYFAGENRLNPPWRVERTEASSADATMRLHRRSASEADIPLLLSLRRETMDTHLAASGADFSDESHLARVMHHFDDAQVLSSNGIPVGLLKVHRGADDWTIVQIQLSPRVQGQGIGRSLVEEILADAASVGVNVKLSVLKANPAKQLYERLGFKVVGEGAHEYFMLHPG